MLLIGGLLFLCGFYDHLLDLCCIGMCCLLLFGLFFFLIRRPQRSRLLLCPSTTLFLSRLDTTTRVPRLLVSAFCLASCCLSFVCS